jgi:hypothetical protein
MVGTVSAQGTVLDDFEDGDISEYGGDTGSFTVQTGTVYEGSYALEASSSSDFDTISDTGIDRHYGEYTWYAYYPSQSDVRGLLFGSQNENGFENGNAYYTISKYFSGWNHDLKSFNSGSRSNSIGSTDESGSIPTGKWLEHKFKWYSNDTIVYEVYDGSRIVKHSGQDSTYGSGGIGWMAGYDGTIYFDKLTYESFNDAPSFDSVSTEPSSWTLGSDVNVSASVSDGDGRVSGVSADVWEDGTQIVSDASLTENSGTWSVTDLFTVDESGVEYELELTATDDDGATSTYNMSQVIEDNLGSITVNQPTGDVFDYDVDYSISHSDNDNVPDETITCDLNYDSNSNGFSNETVTFSEDSTVTGDFRIDTGSKNFEATCYDGIASNPGNLDTFSSSYTVKDFEIQAVSSPGQVYETENIGYTLSYRTGDMINIDETSLQLNWNNSKTNYSFNTQPSSTDTKTVYREVPLIENNDTDFNYSFKAYYNASELNSNTSIRTEKSQDQTQNVLYNYYFDKHSLNHGFTQLEASRLNYSSKILQEKTSTSTDITVQHSFNQTQTSKTGKKINKTSYYNLFDSNLVNDTSKTFKVSADYTISYNGDSRTFSDSKDVQLDKIILNKTNTGAETLKFETRDELNNSLVKGKVEAGIQVNNPDQPGKTRFYGFSFNKDKTHSVYLQPSYAEINANVFDKRSIEYLNTDSNYPKRRYYSLDTLLDNETTNINLYMLQESKGAQVEFELFNSDLKPLESHLIRVERAFPDKEETRTVALVKTGSEGLGSTFLKLDEQYIFTVFNSDGELVDQIGPQSVTTTRKTLEVEDDVPPSFANSIQQVKFTEINEENQSLSVSYISETDRLNSIYLSVYQDDLFGSELISSDSSEQVQGRLEASGFNTSEERVFYELVGTFGETNITLQTGVYGTQTSDYGGAGIFVSFLMFMALTLSGLFRPSAAIGLGVVSIFVMAFTGLLAVGQTALISLAALAAVLIWRMSN